jgi:tetratricopeptide (TPR) repeat protein
MLLGMAGFARRIYERLSLSLFQLFEGSFSVIWAVWGISLHGEEVLLYWGFGVCWLNGVNMVYKKWLLLLFAVVGLGLVTGCAGNRIPDSEILTDATLPEELQQVQRDMARSKPKRALRVLKKWVKKNEDHAAMDEALFLQGQAFNDSKRYYQSLITYEKLLKEHPGSNHFNASLEKQVELAQLFLKGAKRRVLGGLFRFTVKGEALEILDKVAQRWPGSALAGQALVLRANHYFAEEEYPEAQQTYQLLVEHYQSSPHYEMAMRRSAEATYAQYVGPDYDNTILYEADIRFRQFQQNFPISAGDAEINTILNTIASQKIEKEYRIADFYQRTAQPEAARFYWMKIMEKWPESPWALRSQERVAQLP